MRAILRLALGILSYNFLFLGSARHTVHDTDTACVRSELHNVVTGRPFQWVHSRDVLL